MTEQTKLWFIEPKNEEEFNEIVAHDPDTDETLRWYPEETHYVLKDRHYNRFDCYSDRRDLPSGYFEITIKEFREMYGKKEEAVEQTKPIYDQYAQVGDITSDKKGSGARYNNGKPDYSLVVLSQLSQVLSNRGYKLEHAYLLDVLNSLAVFQETQDVSCLYEALNELGMDAIEESTHVFTYGKMKYAAFNWAKGANWSIPLACAVRHLLKIVRDGEEVDEESGRKHVGHIVANVMMMIHYTKYYKEGNDLPPTWMFQEGGHEPN